MKKRDLVPFLYELQGDICPICQKSLLKDMTVWVDWCSQTAIGKKKSIKRRDVNLNIDHIIPVKDGGTSHIGNLALTHYRCNEIKGHVQIYSERPKRGAKLKTDNTA